MLLAGDKSKILQTIYNNMGAREECIEIKNSTELLKFWSPQNICKRSIVDENKIESFEKNAKICFIFTYYVILVVYQILR